MKLNEFFQDQQHQVCTDVDKLELYQKFLYKKALTHRSPGKRFSFVPAKAFLYTSIVALLTLGMYGTYFIRSTSPFTSNLVQADYIAKVVSFNGNFSIEHAGSLSQKKDISNGDTIILDRSAEIIFEINSGTKSKIIGPAKLTIQKVNDNTTYKLNLIYGDYIQMQGSHIPQNVELAIDDILIRQADKSKPIDFQFVNEGKGHIIKNNGASLVVTKNGDVTKREIKNNQILAIQKTDITLFQNWADFAKAVQKGEVTQTFAVATDPSVKTTVTDAPASSGETKQEALLSFMALLAPSTTNSLSEDVTETISQDIATVIKQQKQVLSEEQSKQLRSLLGADFLSNDMAEAYQIQLLGKDGTSKIMSKVKQLAISFGLNYAGELSLASNIARLSDLLPQKYTIPPYYIQNMTILTNRLGVLDTITATSSSWEEYQKSLPDSLIFKYK